MRKKEQGRITTTDRGNTAAMIVKEKVGLPATWLQDGRAGRGVSPGRFCPPTSLLVDCQVGSPSENGSLNLLRSYSLSIHSHTKCGSDECTKCTVQERGTRFSASTKSEPNPKIRFTDKSMNPADQGPRPKS